LAFTSNTFTLPNISTYSSAEVEAMGRISVSYKQEKEKEQQGADIKFVFTGYLYRG
jgi:hypothetical protein